MFVSRRKFIRIGAIAALAAGVPLKSSIVAFSQKISSAGTDPLSLYTQATFTQYLNSVFRLRGSRIVDVTLMKVTDTFPTKAVRAAGQESFTLLFRGGSIELPQDTYTVEHPALGTFKLFLVPGGSDENGAQSYVATINRLGYGSKPVGPRSKSVGTKSGTPSPANGPTITSRSIGAMTSKPCTSPVPSTPRCPTTGWARFTGWSPRSTSSSGSATSTSGSRKG